MDRLKLLSDRFLGIECLLIVSCIDVLFGFPLSGFLLHFLLPSEDAFIVSAALNIGVFVTFGFYIFKSFDVGQLYNYWVKSSIKEYGDLARLNETVSLYSPSGSMESRQIFKSTHENSSVFLADTSLNNSSLRQRSFNTTADADRFPATDRSFFASEEKSNVLPTSMLISSKSPFSSRLFTEGHYNSMLFNDAPSNASTFDEDYFASKKLDWIFNSASLSTSDQGNGSYQVGFINKDKTSDDDQKSDSKDYFSSSYMSTELDVDGSLDTLFASQKKESLRKSSLKANISAKRDALLKKITEWHEDKNASLDESTKKKHVKILIDDLLGSATIHRITFNNAIATDLAYFSANFRSFLSKQVVKPVVQAIDETNQLLRKSGANFSIGTSPVDVLIMAMDQKPDLRFSKMPYLLPFLRIHPNQTLLVNKLRQFVQQPFVMHETIGIKSNTSFEKITGFGDTKTEAEFLSEAEFIFLIFNNYLDYRMAPNSCARQVEKPFTSVYILNEDEKPSIVQLKPKSFFIYARSKKFVSFDFVINGGFDFYVTPTTGTENLLCCFMLMIIYCKQFNDGRIGDIKLDYTGLDLLRLFRSH